MGLAKEFARFLRKQERMHAVWPPIVTNVRVGDYGLFNEGAFQRLGNILEFGVQAATRDGLQSTLKLKSDAVTVVRHEGGAPVDVFHVVDVDARLEIKFEHKSSFFVQSAKLSAIEMDSPNAVAQALAAHPDWRRKFKVVSRVFAGTHVTVLASGEATTDVAITGKAAVLAELEQKWEFTGSLTFALNRELALEVRGKAGPIGVDLFHLGLFGGTVLAGAKAVPSKVEASEVTAVALTDFDSDPIDDL
jgi:hypothetical protein